MCLLLSAITIRIQNRAHRICHGNHAAIATDMDISSVIHVMEPVGAHVFRAVEKGRSSDTISGKHVKPAKVKEISNATIARMVNANAMLVEVQA